MSKRSYDNEDDTIEDMLLKNLVDESKFYTIFNSNNKWDRTMKMASVLTKKYVQGLSKIEEGFCNQNKFVWDIFSVK